MWAHFEFTRNITPRILPKKIEDLMNLKPLILALTAIFNGRIQSSQGFSRFAPTSGAALTWPLWSLCFGGEIALRAIVPL